MAETAAHPPTEAKKENGTNFLYMVIPQNCVIDLF